MNKLVNSNDVVGASYAVSLAPTDRLCFANPALLRPTRTRNNHAVRRASDGVSIWRSTFSAEVMARALRGDPGCVATTDLSVTKTVVDVQDPEGGDEVGPISAVDDTFQYRITVTNPAGNGTATDVDVVDDYPTNLDPAQLGGGCTANATTGDVVCTIAYLEPGTSHTFTITGRTNGSTGASFTNEVSLVDLDQTDPNLGNNTVTIVTETA